MILATFVVAASAITARQYWDQPAKHEPTIEDSLRDGTYHYEPPRHHMGCMHDTPVAIVDEPLYVEPDWGPPTCVGRKQDDHCFRDLYRAQLEAYEANSSYDDMRDISPTGASFALRTVVRRSASDTSY
jgi:hypothetical protein